MLPITFGKLIEAIAGIASPIVKDKFQRNQTVIKLLQQFNLEPDHPPADFTGVYAYALVAYGVSKPKPFLQLFQQEEIKRAFRQAFDHNNPSILLSEVDDFVQAYALGDEVKSLGIDIKREIVAFYIVFSEVAKRTRNPANTLVSQQIASLHTRIVTIQENLDRLPTLEGIRTEMARLAAQDYPALPEAKIPSKNQCDAIALAQQMRGWFETLGYRFEPYEVWSENFFEWIINIPVRRNRYDRILVRGIAGEAGLGDVMALRQSVEQQRTDEGWLVTARRIARAARNEVEKEENDCLGCYTFDELLVQDADFSGYLDWLEAEIKRRKIDTKYVPLACSKEEIDPVTKQQIAVSHYGEEDGWIEGYIDRWLDDPAKEHISILGEFGTGKTWFALHYAWVAVQRYRDAQRRGVQLPRLPLVIPLRDYAKAVSVESLFSEFFFRQYEIPIPGYSAFEQLNRMGKLLLIFDGFDEMAARVNRQEMINNFWELAKVVVPGAKVILTCRTEHFPEAKERRALLNAELQASTANLTGETPQFEVLQLEKFNDEQIRQVLLFQAEDTTVEKVMDNPQLLDLARRPVMTDLILEALPEIEAGKPVDMSRVYLYAVRRKMERDIKAERTFTSLADKLYFLCELSWEMLSTDQMSINYRLFPDRIRRLFGSVVQEEKDLDHWHYDMMGQTMLIRNADGDYTPAHRSLLEFFVAYKFAAELGMLADDFTVLAQGQSNLEIRATPQDYTWSAYFRKQVNAVGEILPIALLKGFVTESLEVLRESFGKAPLTKAVIDLMLGMVGDCQSLVDAIEVTRGRSSSEVGYVGGNAATLAVKLDKGALERRNFSGAVIRGADFTEASLQDTNFNEANLVSCVFTQAFGSIQSAAFNPDGEYLVASDANGQICVWQVADGKEILNFKGHRSWVMSVACCSDGVTFASSSSDETVRLWDIKTGECLQTFHGHTNVVRSVSFSPDSKTIASGGVDTTIRLWDIKTGECVKILQGHTKGLRTIAFSPKGKIIASGSIDGTIRIWDVMTGDCLKILQGHTDWIRSVSFCPDGNTIASGSSDKTVRLWDITTGKCVKKFHAHTNQVNSVSWSYDSKLLASAGDDNTVKLWNINTGECLRILQGHTHPIDSVVFSPNNQILASASHDRTVKLWEVDTGKCLKTLQGYANWVWSVAFNPNSNFLASGSDDYTIRLWDITVGECFKTFRGHKSWLWSVAFSPNGEILASGSEDTTARLWNVNTNECLGILQGHTNRVRSVCFSPDSKIIATASADNTIKLWNVSNGKCIKTLTGHTEPVQSVAFSPNGRILVSGSYDLIVRLWDVETGECIQTLQGHIADIHTVVFSFDGLILASGSKDNTVKLWNIETGQCIQTLQGHTHDVQSLVFSPDDQNLISCSADETVKVWNPKNGECLKTLRGHIRGVWSVAINHEGTIIASSSQDDTIRIWDLKTGECLNILRIPRPYEGMSIKGIRGLTEVEKSTLKALGAVEEVK